MKKIAYLDCSTGISGDMCLGALVHAGVPLDYLIKQLSLLKIDQEYQLFVESVLRNGQQATKFFVDLVEPGADHPGSETTAHHHHHHHVRHLPEIESLIQSAELPVRVRDWSLAIFRTLAIAESEVHGIPPEQVHFHEVGATDAIVDIVGTCLGLDWLDIDLLYCSPLPTGGGMVRAAHGQLPVPVPAVLKLWASRQVPVYSNGIERELCTPTGTAIAVTLVTSFGPPPALVIDRVGLGAGSHQLPIPNILRLWIGSPTVPLGEEHLSLSPNLENISVLETQIDDLSPQAIAYTYEALFNVGALDVFTQPIVMKKSRSGILLTVICHPEYRAACENVLFRETTTLGIRHRLEQRHILAREIREVLTDYGPVRVKVAFHHGNIINVQPEYEDCANIARTKNISWREVYQLVKKTWSDQYS